MSRIGNKPIPIPSGVDIKIEKNLISVKGPKGSLEEKINSENITFEIDGSNFLVSRTNEEIEIKSMHGLYRSLIVTWSKV